MSLQPHYASKGKSMNAALLHQSIHAAADAAFSRSGGPGGQNVNKVNTKVILRLRLADLMGLNEAEYDRLRLVLANRINAEDELLIASDEERSQRSNLERAYSRMEALIVSAARLPRPRRPTKPGKAAKEKRLQSKRLHSQKKAQRQMKGGTEST
jgi:ribosome-associated protein